MKSIRTKLILIIVFIMIIVSLAMGFTAYFSTNRILDEDSDRILSLTVDQSVRDIDEILSSVEQSVGSICNYAEKRAEEYENFLYDEKERELFNYDVAELGKSIAENTPGAMSVYLRYNPEEFGPTEGFWYTININDGTWNYAEPTDMSIYSSDDLEHVGWYYIPVETGKPLWMDPYFNSNLGIDMISYIIPYYHDGHTVGVIGMDIDLKLLRDFVSEINLYDSGRAFLVSPKGDIIFHFDYPEGVRSKDLTENLTPFIDSVLGNSLNEVRTLKGIDGIKRKILMKRVRNGMILGLNAPVNEINVPQNTLTRRLIMISVLILILAVALCLAFVRTVTAPLKRMTEVAGHYANGDYSDVMNTDSSDEIGILSRSLQTMSTSLKDQIEIADAANKSKSIFLAKMSHEIRTPINAILGFDEMILRESNEAVIKEYAANIKNSGQTLLALVNEILDFSKIESGRLEILPVDYEIAALIGDMLDMIEFRATEKNLEIRYNIDSEIPSVLHGDDIRLREVLTNLLTNSVKYTPSGSIKLTVYRLTSDGSTVRLRFSVEDTGIGIKDEDKGHLWESFQRLDEQHNRGIEGTGLGLAITRKYIELMGGCLHLNSTYGQGSEFWFEIDQGIVNPDPIGDFDKERKSFHRDVEVYTEGFEAPDAHILVVDDVKLNLVVIKGLLKNSGLNIDTAESGAEAIEKMKSNRYDIVFLDHMMPEMDGMETLTRIFDDPDIDTSSTPIIALTANAISGVDKMYREHGFSDYLSKPIDPSVLEKMLLKYLPDELVIRKN
ncbi:MAG: response regulator [Lachnospiraceae bacterium]|nr:response regulator [Lachnospiraceae bacterium]